MFILLLVAYIVWGFIYLLVVGALVAYFVGVLLVYWGACGVAFAVARIRGTAVEAKVQHPSFHRPQFELSEQTKESLANLTAFGAAVGLIITFTSMYHSGG